MKIPIIFVADRGGLKAYQVKNKTPKLLEHFPVDDARGRMQDKLTDKAGAFPNGGSAGQGNSIAERMSLKAEYEMRSFRKIASRLNELLTEEKPDRWAFAAPAEINAAILDGLPAEHKDHLAVNVRADLLNVPQERILAHFSNAT